MKRLIILLVVLLGAGMARCTVGPNYKRPLVAVPETYRGAAAAEPLATDAASIGDQAWWDVFHDDQLRELIRTALQRTWTFASPRHASCKHGRNWASPG